MSVQPLHADRTTVAERNTADQGDMTAFPDSEDTAPRRHPLRRLLRLAASIVLAIVVAASLIVAIAEARARDGVATVLGHPVLVVLSGSMTPTFRPGDLVIDRGVSTASATHLHPGQIVTFHEPGTASTSDQFVTHRILRVEPTSAGTVEYVTKGDDNNAADPWVVSPAQVVGLYQTHLPKAGYLLRALRDRLTLLVAVLLAVAWVGESEFRRRWRQAGRAGSTSSPEDQAQGGSGA